MVTQTAPNGAAAPAAGGQPLGKNVVARLEGQILTLTVDLAQNFGLSGSGKSTIIATASGNVLIPGTNARLGLTRTASAKHTCRTCFTAPPAISRSEPSRVQNRAVKLRVG